MPIWELVPLLSRSVREYPVRSRSLGRTQKISGSADPDPEKNRSDLAVNRLKIKRKKKKRDFLRATPIAEVARADRDLKGNCSLVLRNSGGLKKKGLASILYQKEANIEFVSGQERGTLPVWACARKIKKKFIPGKEKRECRRPPTKIGRVDLASEGLSPEIPKQGPSAGQKNCQ